MKILVYSQLSLEQQHILEEKIDSDQELMFINDLSDQELIKSFAETSILIGNPPASFFQHPHPLLQFWQIDSAGFNQYQDLDLTIPVANMGSFFADRCAETIVSGILAYYRGLHELVKLQLEKKWDGNRIRKTIQGIAGKNVLILGAGAIGLACRRMLTGFNCNITIAARKNPIAQFHEYDHVLATLPNIDVVINTLPGTATNYVSSKFIKAMKSGSIYANVGRGNTTDEKALIKALKSRKLSGAILDVTEIEPLPKGHELWEMESVVLTQHSGGGDVNEGNGKVEKIAENVNRFINDETPLNLVNIKTGY